MQHWFRFCTEKVNKIEKVWNRKLDEPEKEDVDSDHAAHDDEGDEHENTIEKMLSNFENARQNRAQSAQRAPPSHPADGLLADMQAAMDEPTSKDDVFD